MEIEMRRVNFRLESEIVLEVRTLRGRLRRTKPDHPVTFEDTDSFIVEIDTAEVAITTASLSALLNSYIFAYPEAPIKNMHVNINGSRLIQKGTIHKGVDLSFEIEGPVSATPDGNIRLHAEKIKSAHIPFKGLLHLFGADLSDLVNKNAGRGAKIEGDDTHDDFGFHGTSHYIAPTLSWRLANGTTLRISPGFGMTETSGRFLLRFGVSYEVAQFGCSLGRLFR